MPQCPVSGGVVWSHVHHGLPVVLCEAESWLPSSTGFSCLLVLLLHLLISSLVLLEIASQIHSSPCLRVSFLGELNLSYITTLAILHLHLGLHSTDPAVLPLSLTASSAF